MANLVVQKYGGTSVGSVDRIKAVADIISKTTEAGDKVVVVLSAMEGETDKLIDLARSIDPNPEPREYDALVSTGEQTSVALMAMALSKKGLKSKSYTAYQLGIITNDKHTQAKILDVKVDKINKDINEGIIPVVTGFQGMNETGDITTLGRGGSDTTGVALAVALEADK